MRHFWALMIGNDYYASATEVQKSPGGVFSSPRIVSLTDVWIWILSYTPCSNELYRYKNGLLELPMRNGISPLGIGLNETNEVCVCFASDVPSGTNIEQLDGDFLPCC